ncbi:hypothetical protein FACS189459_0460 [Bacilli bacterium]|nr:hypothetical protein FACS189459_0460 [Bacilli bacterium]
MNIGNESIMQIVIHTIKMLASIISPSMNSTITIPVAENIVIQYKIISNKLECLTDFVLM